LTVRASSTYRGFRALAARSTSARLVATASCSSPSIATWQDDALRRDEAADELRVRLEAAGGEDGRDALRQLRDVGQMSESAFLSDARTNNSAKYLLIVAAEAALDICNHLAARRGARSPEDYADCMAVMAELGVIGPKLRDRLARMARFRNLLVHLYARVDDGRVYRVIRDDLGDFDEYLMSVARYLKADLG